MVVGLQDLPHAPPDATDIVVQVTDILFEYLPPDSGIEPELAVQRGQQRRRHGRLGCSRYPCQRGEPEDIVARLAEVLDAPAPDPREQISRLLEVVERPLAIAVDEQEMDRRKPPPDAKDNKLPSPAAGLVQWGGVALVPRHRVPPQCCNPRIPWTLPVTYQNTTRQKLYQEQPLITASDGAPCSQ